MFSNNMKFYDKRLKVVSTSKITTQAITGKFVDITNISRDAVKCNECNEIHIVPNEEEDKVGKGKVNFITIYGSMMANDGGGLLGNGDWDKYGVTAYHFCPSCLKDFIDKIVGSD